MKELEWKDEYLLGIPAIDLQHKRILDQLVTVAGGSTKEDGLLAEFAIVQLVHLIEQHFAIEESMMRTLCYGGLERHIEEHRQFHADVHDWAQNCLRTKTSVSRETIKVAHNWMREHILVSDKHYVDFFSDPARVTVPSRILLAGLTTKRQSDGAGQ